MRFTTLVAATLLLSFSVTASAQEWIDNVSKEDRFTANFPGQPAVTQMTYKSQYRAICRRGSTVRRRGRAATR